MLQYQLEKHWTRYSLRTQSLLVYKDHFHGLCRQAALGAFLFSGVSQLRGKTRRLSEVKWLSLSLYRFLLVKENPSSRIRDSRALP